MKIMLDLSPARISELTEKYDYEFWQLRTPLTQYKRAGVPYGLDNGCFSVFHKDRWLNMVKNAQNDDLCKFVCLPDIVGDAARTMDLYKSFKWHTQAVPRALVLQDGIGNHRIDWHEIDAVFVGGSDNFKISQEAIAAAKCAKMLDKWVHVGRVNTVARCSQWMDLGDSIDGSGLCHDEDKIARLVNLIKHGNKQIDLLEEQV